MTPMQIDLTEQERSMLRAGVTEWGGPAGATDELAIAMGFVSRDDLFAQSRRLIGALRTSEPLEPFDWARVLVLTEFVFASNVFGSGLDWSITTGIQDAEAIKLLRSLQRKFGRAGAARGQFGPTSHQEFQWQSDAATAIRIYKHGSSNLMELLAAIDETLSGFHEDLDELRAFRARLAALTVLAESDQRGAVAKEIRLIKQSFENRHDGDPGRRRFWI